MKNKRIRSRTALSWLLVLGLSLVWLGCMTLLTFVLAQDIYDRFYDAGCAFPEDVDLSEYYDKDSPLYAARQNNPDVLEYNILRIIAAHREGSLPSYGPASWDPYSEVSRLIRLTWYPLETAVLFYDGDGNLLHASDDDVLFFSYFTREEWIARRDFSFGTHFGWIDISSGKDADWQEDPYRRFRVSYAGTRSLFDIETLRITGRFEGTRFFPVSIYFTTRSLPTEWQLQFDNSSEHTGEELVTIYAVYPEMWDYPRTRLTYDGTEYDSLAALTKAFNFPEWAKVHINSDSFKSLGKYGLNELLIFNGRKYADLSGTEPAKTEYFLITAIRCHPLRCAVSALRNIYILSGLAVLILFFILRSTVIKRLAKPLEELSAASSVSSRYAYRPDSAGRAWREAAQLSDYYGSAEDSRRKNEDEITRLKTSLNYAKSAEQKRREMISALAHELKTPVAVIHSYAEGLKEHIAEEKREKYLDTILSEAERTDALILEMLDLSRLEAGKVKLSREAFSLPALTRRIFEKMALAAQEKDLKIDFCFPDDLTVTADESRIAQAVENFATNAIKYTPGHGRISVRIRPEQGCTAFRIENDCEPLSAEALRKVWDAFYRADDARSDGGTGLGLAITRNIIRLHGGDCSVRNTDRGVEFAFTLPD